MVGVVETMPADPVGRVGVVAIDKDQVEAVADDEAVVGANIAAGVALKALALGAATAARKSTPTTTRSVGD
jgi:hypothetical protein